MLTRQDKKQIVKAMRELEWFKILNHPYDVLDDEWDYHHYRNLRQFAEKGRVAMFCGVPSHLRRNARAGRGGHPHKVVLPSMVPSISRTA